jgi:cellulase
MECAQINVVGGTGSASPTTYSIPGIYKATDPGLLINIYTMTSSSTYTIPGPPVFSCGAGGSSPSSSTSSKAATSTTLATSTTKATTSSTSTKATTSSTTTTKATTTSSAAGSTCTAAQWAQCGGIGYTGCTTCASGYKCNYSNDYYSQCY